MIGPWGGIGLILAALFALFALLKLWQKLGSPHPEITRKAMHVSMGLLTLSFPWLFQESWPVLLLAAASVGLMLSLRTFRPLKQSLGDVVCGVERTSWGEIWFPIAVCILFHLYLWESEPRPERRLLFYVVPILLLSVADAAAALIGLRYGSLHYATSDGRKSTEGSLAFFLCAFLCIHVPVLLGTNVGRLESLLIAVLLAWLAMMFEAISWAGLDNLALPLVSYLLLKTYVDMPAEELANRFALTAVLVLVVIVYHRRTTLLGDALLGALLVGYICWSLGGWRWLLPPLIFFVSYPLLAPRKEPQEQRIHNVHAVACVSSAGLTWLFLARILERPDFLFPGTVSFAVHLAMVSLARHNRAEASCSRTTLVLSVFQGWLLMLLPWVLLEFSVPAVWLGLLALPLVWLGTEAFSRVQPRMEDCPLDGPRWYRQAAVAAVASALAFPLLGT